MNAISVDPGIRSTGLFLFRDGKGRAQSILRADAGSWGHLVDLRGRLLRYAKGIDVAFVEGYPYGLPAGQAAYAIEAGGVAREVCAELGLPLVVVEIATWKALTIGNLPKSSKAQRELYLDTVETKYGRQFDTVDQADAYLIYRAALRLWEEGGGGATGDRIRAGIAVARQRMEERGKG